MERAPGFAVTPPLHTRDMTCFECDPTFGGNLWHCHEVSVLHHDGSTECLSGTACELRHELHHWQLSCAELDPPCPCGQPSRGDAPAGPPASTWAESSEG